MAVNDQILEDVKNKYLDGEGLATLWSLIKSKFQDKATLADILADYAKLDDIANAIHLGGVVNDLDEVEEPVKGDVYFIQGTAKEYLYDGDKWVELGDESLYLTKEEFNEFIGEPSVPADENGEGGKEATGLQKTLEELEEKISQADSGLTERVEALEEAVGVPSADATESEDAVEATGLFKELEELKEIVGQETIVADPENNIEAQAGSGLIERIERIESNMKPDGSLTIDTLTAADVIAICSDPVVEETP